MIHDTKVLRIGTFDTSIPYTHIIYFALRVFVLCYYYLQKMSAIDFRELMRLEKRRMRIQKSNSASKSKDLNDVNNENIGSIQSIDIIEQSSENLLGIDEKTRPLHKNILDEQLSKLLENSQVGAEVLRDVFYIEKFLCPNFERKLTRWLKSLPKINNNERNVTSTSGIVKYHGKWKRLEFASRSVTMFDFRVVQEIPPLLKVLIDMLLRIRAFPDTHPPNHVLVNEYQDQEGIMAHTDGPMYLDRTATFSIAGGDVLFNFTKRKANNSEDDDSNNDVMQLKLHGNGSLVVFTDDAYTNHCHSINDRIHNSVEHASCKCVNAVEGEQIQRGHRLSLTFRHKFEEEI